MRAWEDNSGHERWLNRIRTVHGIVCKRVRYNEQNDSARIVCVVKITMRVYEREREYIQ